jgi:hypothetical protein
MQVIASPLIAKKICAKASGGGSFSDNRQDSPDKRRRRCGANNSVRGYKMAKVFRWRYAWRRTGRQAHFGECTLVEQVEVHEDGSTEVVGFEIRGAGSDSTWLYGADEVELLKELVAKRRLRESRGTFGLLNLGVTRRKTN